MPSTEHDRHHIAVWNTDLDQLPPLVVAADHGSQISDPFADIPPALGPIDGLDPVIHELFFAIDRDFDVNGLVLPKGGHMNTDLVHGDGIMAVLVSAKGGPVD